MGIEPLRNYYLIKFIHPVEFFRESDDLFKLIWSRFGLNSRRMQHSLSQVIAAAVPVQPHPGCSIETR